MLEISWPVNRKEKRTPLGVSLVLETSWPVNRKDKTTPFGVNSMLETTWPVKRKEKDYTTRRQFGEKPGAIPYYSGLWPVRIA